MAGTPRKRERLAAAAASLAIADAEKPATAPGTAPKTRKKGGKAGIAPQVSPGVSSTPKAREEHDTQPPHKKVGRPSSFSQPVADEILARLANGQTLNAICREAHMPQRATVMRWCQSHEHKEFSQAYRRARELQFEHWADEVIDCADDSSRDFVDRVGKDGEVSRLFDPENTRRSHLRIESRKWLLGKLKPSQYGDLTRSQVELTGKNGGPIEVDNRPKNNTLEIARRTIFVLQRAQDQMALEDQAKVIDMEPVDG